jgi:hypothetical protein
MFTATEIRYFSSGGPHHGKSHFPHPSLDPVSPTRPMPVTSADWDIKFLERCRLHDGAVIGSDLWMVKNEKSMLVTTSLDGGLKVHSVDANH